MALFVTEKCFAKWQQGNWSRLPDLYGATSEWYRTCQGNPCCGVRPGLPVDKYGCQSKGVALYHAFLFLWECFCLWWCWWSLRWCRYHECRLVFGGEILFSLGVVWWTVRYCTDWILYKMYFHKSETTKTWQKRTNILYLKTENVNAQMKLKPLWFGLFLILIETWEQ